MNSTTFRFVYFAGEPLGVPVAEQLEKAGLLPSLVVCNPDRPSGRKQLLTPPPIKVWAESREIPVWQPESLKERSMVEENLAGYDLFVVVAYNNLLPQWLIELPKHQTINLHPSLLPLYRGASPIRSAILDDRKDAVGVSVMLLDEKMDHGPLLAQETMEFADDSWPVPGQQFDKALAALGGELLAETVPAWVAGEIAPQEQDHQQATYCSKLDRSMGELTIDPFHLPTGDEAYQALLKIRAFDGFPGTYFIHNDKRVKVLSAHLHNNHLVIDEVVPEGKRQQSFTDYLQSLDK